MFINLCKVNVILYEHRVMKGYYENPNRKKNTKATTNTLLTILRRIIN